ncbi:glycosyltransferase [Erwinia sp. CPCC 100877]|nr:glycosyltransferase [Erwinia sp. CPCC 100877]
MKYDFELSLDEHTSVGKILAQIDDNSKVLEFGPGNGRMTKYLVEKKQCDVSIVEFDEELYNFVMQFAKEGFLGNIEEYRWTDHFDFKSFDYIVFADVLEHLTNPEKTLEQVLPFLAENGRILISFPNIAHNSVLIDLFNNKLNLNKYGLLDATHNTFYTQSGFEALFARLGLNIAVEDYTYSQVGQNEIDASYADLPVTSRYDFKNRMFGEVYQYFYSLSLNPVANPIRKTPENSNFVEHVRLEYAYPDRTESSVLLLNNRTGESKEMTLDVPVDVQSIKLYPSNEASIVHFKSLIKEKELRSIETNALWQNDSIYVFEDAKGYFLIDGKYVANQKLTLNFDFLFEGQYTDIQEQIIHYSVKQKQEVKKLQEELVALEKKNNDKVQFMAERYNEVVSAQKNDGWLSGSTTPKKERDALITLNIETVENDEELNQAIIKGWGFSNKTKEPLRFALQSNEGAFYKVTSIKRQDVIDINELSEDVAYGFIIEIENYQIDKMVHLIITTANDEKIYMPVNRYNLAELSFAKRSRILLGAIRRKGIIGALRAYKERNNQQDAYEKWILANEQYDNEQILQEIAQWQFQPKISIVIPVYNVEEKWLNVCIESLQKQFYTNWELCIADDASSKEYIRPLLEDFMRLDDRIKVVFREENGHISEATNSALGITTGDYIGFMDNDDELAPNALFEVVKALNEDNQIDFIYTDEDKISTRGKRFDPFFKPDWNSELLLGHNYITHFVVVKKDLVLRQVGGLRDEFNGSQDYDFVLRATEAANKIYHIPKILYHWRTVETSVAFDPQSKEYAYTAGQRAIEAALERRDILGTVQMTKNYGAYKVNYQFNVKPKVSILFVGPVDKQAAALQRFVEKTYYNNVEFLVSKELKESVGQVDNRIVFVEGESLNQQAASATGEYLAFVSEYVEPENSRWLNELMNFGQKLDVGLVGGKVINQFDTILNVGISIDQATKSLFYEQRGISNKSIGYYFRPVLPRELQAVTEDCMLIRKSDFEKVSGFNESLGTQLMGVDLSLKVQGLSKKIVFTPYAEMIALEGICHLEGKDSAKKLFDIWTSEQLSDDYKNPNSLN